MAPEKTKNNTAIAKLLRPKKRKEKGERKRRYITELRLARKTSKQVYHCYRYIDKLCEVAIEGQ